MNCPDCILFTICPSKPSRQDYDDENQYLIDTECGVWDCERAVTTLNTILANQTKLKDTVCSAIIEAQRFSRDGK